MWLTNEKKAQHCRMLPCISPFFFVIKWRASLHTRRLRYGSVRAAVSAARVVLPAACGPPAMPRNDEALFLKRQISTFSFQIFPSIFTLFLY